MNLEEALSGKAGLTGVQWALNGRSVRQKIRAGINGLLSDGCQIRRMRLTRAKYKPGRKLSMYFDVETGQSGLRGQGIRPVAVSWSTRSELPIPDGMTDGQADAYRRGLAAPFEKLWAGFPEMGMQVYVSPLDPAFPQLVRLSDPGFVQTRLAETLSAGKPEWEHVRVAPIRYRPGERHVLRFDREIPGEAGRIFTKLYKNAAGAARAGRIADRVIDWLEARENPLGGVRPLAVWEGEAAVLFPRAPGVQLSSLLRHPDHRMAPAALRAAGAGLRGLHEGPAELGDELVARPIEEEIRLIARAAEHLQVLIPETHARVQSLLERAQNVLTKMPQEPITFTHSDFKADHVLVNPHGLTLIDFDTCALADPALDVGKFLADLDYWFIRNQVTGVREAQALFLEGYAPGAPEERLRRARVYHALILVKITARRVRLYERNWAEQTMGLIRRVDEVLGA